MDPILLGTLGSLAASLASNYITKGGEKTKRKLDEHQLERDFKAVLTDAVLAFRACVPKGVAIENLGGFFESDVMAAAYQAALQGTTPNLTALEAAFRYISWAGEYKLTQRLQEKLHQLQEIGYGDSSLLHCKINREGLK